MSRVMTSRQMTTQRIGQKPENPSRPPRFGYLYPLTFGAIAAGGTGSVEVKTLTSGFFVVQASTGVLRNSTTGTRADIDAATPEMYVSFSINEGSWQSGELEWGAVVGQAREAFFWQFAPVVAGGATIKLSLRNASAVPLRGQVVLAGYVDGTL